VTEWLVGLGALPLVPLGWVAKSWYDSRRKQNQSESQDATQAYRDVAHKCEEKLDKMETRLDKCEEEHSITRESHARLETRLSLLEAKKTRRSKPS
jgi:chromosome segregation ATPase